MGSNLTFVWGAMRLDLNERIGLFMQVGYYPSVDVSKKTVTETVKVQLRDPISANIQTLNRLFAIARNKNPAEDKVYVEYKPAEGETAWRSRIYDGAISAGSNLAKEFGRGRVNVEISFERDAFWEGPEEVLPIGNVNGSTTPNVFNCNDRSGFKPNRRVNSAIVTGNLILGDMPTPVKLTMENLYDEALGHLWIGMNNSRPNWISGWMLEAESAIGVTPVTSAIASGGAFVQGQLTYGSAQPILRWAVADSLVSWTRSQRLRMLLRPYYTGQYAAFKYKLRITADGLTPLFETDWIRESQFYARHWLDLFEFRLPPWLEGKENLAGLTLELWATPIQAGTWRWAFDDVMLFPQDGFVNLDTSTEPGGKVIIDGDEGWSEDASGKKWGLRKMVGSLMLKPAALHMFYFAMHGIGIDSAPIDFSLAVSGSYRPRRLLL